MAKRTAKEVITRALSEVGNTEVPAGSNRNKYGKAYGMDGVPWCAIFVWWVLNYGKDAVMPKTAYTPTIWNWAKGEGILKPASYKAKAGDLVLFQFPALKRINHVGIVIKDRTSSSDALYCVEGNTSGSDPRNGGMVAATKRKSYIMGIVDMSGRYAKPAPAKPKLYVNTPKGKLNMRKSPVLGSKVLKELAHRTAVTVIKTGRYWTKCSHNGTTGYCSSKYLVKKKPAPHSYYYPRYKGSSGSIILALNSLGIDYSFANRKKIAAGNGMKKYTGTAEQNIMMLALLKEGKLKR